MKTWIAALVTTLGLATVTAWADGPAPLLDPSPAVAKPVIAAPPAPSSTPCATTPDCGHTGGCRWLCLNSLGLHLGKPCASCGQSSCGCGHKDCCAKLRDWLCYWPQHTGTNLACVGPRPPQAWTFFLEYPCFEGCGPNCGQPACHSCAPATGCCGK